jgi:hypothetical protein
MDVLPQTTAPAAAPAAEPTPAPAGRGRLLREVGWHLAFALATVAVLFAGLRLETADIHAPFEYDGDALLILPFVKATLERGSHWRNERLGAPGIQELHDFPVVDHLHFAVIWLIGLAVPGPFVVFNLYYLLTYPLTTLTGMFVLRRLGLSIPAAGVGGVLYAFQPYHYLRGQMHYFLAAYWVVPLTLLVALRVCQGRLPFFRREADGRYRFRPWTWDALGTVLVAAATASGGAYYAFFGCALLACAGLYAWVSLKTWRAAASTGLVLLLVFVGGLANHAPAFAYQYRYGRNSAPTARLPEEAEIYGLKLTQMLLPIPHHNWSVFAAVQSSYDSGMRPLQNANKASALGLVGATGLVGLLAAAVLPGRRGWPLGPLAFLAVCGVLLSTVGGVGAVFNHLVSPQVRDYSRISIYLAFLALAAACRALDRLLNGRAGWVKWVAFPALAVIGVWDQTNSTWFRAGQAGHRTEEAARFRADATFFAEVERALPGGTVFCLPFNAYPESPSFGGGMSAYYHIRGYLHTHSLRWSFGAMKGREADLWQREVACESPAEMLPRLVARGFDGLLIDRRGYSPAEADQLTAEVSKEIGADAPRVEHPGTGEVVYDLRGYCDRLRAGRPAEFEALCRREAEAVSVLWLDGFYSFEPFGQEWKHRWCGPKGVAVFVNPTDRPRAFRVEAVFRSEQPEFTDVRIDGGPVWTERFPVNKDSPMTSRVIVVPPGRHTVRFRGRLPDGYLSGEPRRLTFFIAQWRMTEVRADAARSP